MRNMCPHFYVVRGFSRLSQSPFWNTDFSSLLRAFFTDLYCGRGLAMV